MAPVLSELKPVDLRCAWETEPTHFTPWLANPENLNKLANVLGISNLDWSATEHPVGDFRLDILCTSNEETVIIENQLTVSDHDHLGKILTYAAGTTANKVIWIAKDFRPEHIAAIDYLNQNTSENLSFFAVRIELWQIEDSKYAPYFEVIAKPNNWSSLGRKQAKEAQDNSPIRQLQLKLWTKLAEALINQRGIRPSAPQPQHYFTIAIGHAGFKLAAVIHRQLNSIQVELYIDHPEATAKYEALLIQQQIIENEIGYKLDWQGLPDRHACRIAYSRENCPLSVTANWPDYINWFVENLNKFQEVFQPKITNLP